MEEEGDGHRERHRCSLAAAAEAEGALLAPEAKRGTACPGLEVMKSAPLPTHRGARNPPPWRASQPFPISAFSFPSPIALLPAVLIQRASLFSSAFVNRGSEGAGEEPPPPQLPEKRPRPVYSQLPHQSACTLARALCTLRNKGSSSSSRSARSLQPSRHHTQTRALEEAKSLAS